MITPTIVILGAGPAGLSAALTLKRQLGKTPARLIVIDKQSHYVPHSALFRLLLPPKDSRADSVLVKKSLEPESIEFWEDIVQSIEPITRELKLFHHTSLSYDYLVIALGCQPNRWAIPGLADHALFAHSIHDLVQLRARLAHRQRLGQSTHIVIGGGGENSVELAKALSQYGLIHNQALTISILEPARHLLIGQSHKNGERAERELSKIGVDLYLNQPIQKVRPHNVIVKDGRSISADIFLWTGELIGNPLIKAAGFTVDSVGRAIVNQALQAKGYSRVFVVGSASSSYAQKNAVQQTIKASQNIIRLLEGKLPQNYLPTSWLAAFAN